MKSNAELEINQLRQVVQDARLEHPGVSSTFERLDNAGRLSPPSDFQKSVGVLISKLEPITKIIDDVSHVS